MRKITLMRATPNEARLSGGKPSRRRGRTQRVGQSVSDPADHDRHRSDRRHQHRCTSEAHQDCNGTITSCGPHRLNGNKTDPAGQTGEALEYVGNAHALSPFSAVRRTLGEVGRSVRWSQACLESFFCYSNSC